MADEKMEPHIVESLRFCRQGDLPSLMGALMDEELDVWVNKSIRKSLLLNSGVSEWEYDNSFKYLDPISSERASLRSPFTLALVSGSSEVVDFIIGCNDFVPRYSDFYVALGIGTTDVLRRLTWIDILGIYTKYAGDNMATLLGKAAFNNYATSQHNRAKVVEYAEKVEFLCRMGVSMAEVDPIDGTTPVSHMVSNRVPVEIIKRVCRTLTPAQVNHVNDNGESMLYTSICSQQLQVASFLIDTGSYIENVDAYLRGDMRRRACPMALLVRYIWLLPICQYQLLMKLVNRNRMLFKHRYTLKYKIVNIFIYRTMVEMGLTLVLSEGYMKKAIEDANVDRATALHMLGEYVSNPKSLQSLCRKAIIKSLPKDRCLYHSVDRIDQQTSLPHTVRDYLMFTSEKRLVKDHQVSTKEKPIPYWYGSKDEKSFFDEDVHSS